MGLDVTPLLNTGLGMLAMGILAYLNKQRKLRNNNIDPIETTPETEAVDPVQEALDSLKSQVEQLKSERNQALQDTGKLRADFTSQVLDLQKQIDSLKEDNKRQTDELAKVKIERDTAEAKYHKLLENHTEAQQTIISMGKELDQLTTDVGELKHQLAVNTSVEQAFMKFGDKLVDKLSTAINSRLPPVVMKASEA
jgi:chromosome segregation ATPase